MDMYKLKFTKLQNEIFRLLCIRAGTGLAKREIAGLLKVSPTAVSKSLNLLEGEGLARVERPGKANIFSVRLERENPKAIALKRSENLRIAAESGLLEFLAESLPGCTIILFGSYSLGEDTVGSDIDIAVVGARERDMDVSGFEKMAERRIILHFFDSFGGMDKNLRNSILGGIILEGSIEL